MSRWYICTTGDQEITVTYVRFSHIFCYVGTHGYPFRAFKTMGLEFIICQTKWNQFVSFLLKVWHWRKWITQRIKIVKTYYKNTDSATATHHALRGDYGSQNRPTTQAIDKIVKKFKFTNIEIINLDSQNL